MNRRFKNVLTQLRENPGLSKNLKIEITTKDLFDYSDYLIEQSLIAGKFAKMEEVLLTPYQLAKRLNVSMVTLFNWEKIELIKSTKIGKIKYFKYIEIEKIITEYAKQKPGK